MKVLWMTWKDRSHPRSGGAEIVNEELAKRLARAGHEVVFLVAGFGQAPIEDERDGFKIIRLGDHYTVYWHAYRYYRKHFEGWADVVIDELNTMPFFCRFYVKERTFFFPHQLCREVWFYQMPFPMSVIGYCLEPLYLWLLRGYEVITVSRSTKEDLLRYGFASERIHIIPEGIEIAPVPDIATIIKYAEPTVLSLGSIRAMKRTKHQIAAFELAKKTIPNLKMKIAGDAQSEYGNEVLRMIAHSPYRRDIEFLGRVTKERKAELMQKSQLIMVTSVKEGWGLIVTEAGSQGTPAVVYNVDGLRDSVEDGVTGLITRENTENGLAEAIVRLLNNPEEYAKMRNNAYQASFKNTFEAAYEHFFNIIKP